jgi:DNA uptake protein ComE-like DNA-binding protein
LLAQLSPDAELSDDPDRTGSNASPVPSAASANATPLASEMPRAAPVASPVPVKAPSVLASAVSNGSLARKPDADPPADLVRPSGLVDLNTAPLHQLNALRGAGLIGRAIVRGRPYASAEDLVKKRVLNRSTYARIKNQITAR